MRKASDKKNNSRELYRMLLIGCSPQTARKRMGLII